MQSWPKLLRLSGLATVLTASALTAAPQVGLIPQITVSDGNEEADADLPPRLHAAIPKETYQRLRDEYIGRLRGMEPGFLTDLSWRNAAIRELDRQLSQRDPKT